MANGPALSDTYMTELNTHPINMIEALFCLELVNATLGYGKALDSNVSANISDEFDCLMVIRGLSEVRTLRLDLTANEKQSLIPCSIIHDTATDIAPTFQSLSVARSIDDFVDS